MKRILPAFLLGAFCAATLSAQTIVAQWRFGEGDAGASNGSTIGAITKDSVGSTDLTRTGSATYTSATPGNGSTLAALGDTSVAFSGNSLTSLSTNSSFFMEVWFKPTSVTGAQTLIYNGDGSFRGLGLYLLGTDLRILAGGQFDNPTNGVVSPGNWNYAALVWDNRSVNVYLNSVAAPVYSATRDFNAADVGDSIFFGGLNGGYDEASVMTFTSGTFNTAMLNYSTVAVPEPSTYAALAGVAALGLVAWRRRAVRA